MIFYHFPLQMWNHLIFLLTLKDKSNYVTLVSVDRWGQIISFLLIFIIIHLFSSWIHSSTYIRNGIKSGKLVRGKCAWCHSYTTHAASHFHYDYVYFFLINFYQHLQLVNSVATTYVGTNAYMAVSDKC